jgi:hypothetical protein
MNRGTCRRVAAQSDRDRVVTTEYAGGTPVWGAGKREIGEPAEQCLQADLTL